MGFVSKLMQTGQITKFEVWQYFTNFPISNLCRALSLIRCDFASLSVLNANAGIISF